MRRVGIDENGLGAQLGPLVVTAVEAEVEGDGAKLFTRKLPKSIRADLDDSKALVSCHDVSLGEAWARVVLQRTLSLEAESPRELTSKLLFPKETALRRKCPKTSEGQCWGVRGEKLTAEPTLLERLERHLVALEKRGLKILSARSEVVCSSTLSQLRRQGTHRFAADLGAMERLLLSLEDPNSPFLAVCGKVGGIGKYGDFFTALSSRLYSTLEEGRAQSSYHFPHLGEVRFVRDADSKDPLVMLASLIGKYLRELFMGRIGRFYGSEGGTSPSGYHDPVTKRFVSATQGERRRLQIADDCFIRSREEVPKKATSSPRKRALQDPAQSQLF